MLEIHPAIELTPKQMETEIQKKITDHNAQERFKEDLAENNNDIQKRENMINNVYLIEDVDGYYHRFKKYSCSIKYEENYFILNQNIPLSPVAYNSLGKIEIITQKLIHISHIPWEESRKKEVSILLKDYGCSELENKVENFVNGQLNEYQKDNLNEALSEIDKKRKDEIFKVSAAYKHENGSYHDITKNIEKELCGQLTLEEWYSVENNLEKRKSTMTPAEYDQKKCKIASSLYHTKEVRKTRKIIDSKLYDNEVIQLITAKQQCVDAILKKGELTKEDAEKLYDDLKKNEEKTGDLIEAEKNLNGGKCLEEWEREKSSLLKEKPTNYEERLPILLAAIRKSKAMRAMHDFIKMEKAIIYLEKNGLHSYEDFLKKKCGGSLQELEEKLKNLKIQQNQSKKDFKADQANIKKNLGEAELMEKAKAIAYQNVFQKKILEYGGPDFLLRTQEYIKKTVTFANQEKLTTIFDANVVKKNIEESFRVVNYRDVEVKGAKIFENLNDIQLTRFSACFTNMTSPNNMVSACMAIINDENSSWNVANANDFGDGIKLFGEFLRKQIKNQAGNIHEYRRTLLQSISTGIGDDFNNAMSYFKERNDEINRFQHKADFQSYRTKWTAAAHAEKHYAAFKNETSEDYLTWRATNLFKSENETVCTPAQDGMSFDTEYIMPDSSDDYYLFGVTSTNYATGNRVVTTMFKKTP